MLIVSSKPYAFMAGWYCPAVDSAIWILFYYLLLICEEAIWIAQWFKYLAAKSEVGSLIPGSTASLGGLGPAAQSQGSPPPEEGNGEPLLNILYLENPGKVLHKSELT